MNERGDVLALPEISPHLAWQADEVPAGDQWLHEIKFDGYRIIAYVNGDLVKLMTRNGNDWSDRFPELAEALKQLGLGTAVFDGEVVALNAEGVSEFQLLQTSFRRRASGKLVYQIFDLLFLDGEDLRDLSLDSRKSRLARLLKGSAGTRLQNTDHILGNGPQFFDECCKLGLEGIVSKQRDQPYRSGRHHDWLKSKCVNREEFVIGGFTPSKGNPKYLGALLVGRYDNNKLIFAGKVGSGFTWSLLEDLTATLNSLRQEKCPFAEKPDIGREKVTWVEPQLICQVQFANWTDDGHLRHPAFQGIREDLSSPTKTPRDNSYQQSLPHIPEEKLAQLSSMKLTHPEKILYPAAGITKLDVVRYFVSISDWILPHLKDRPLSLVRFPHGMAGQGFYQKHPAAGTPPEIGRVEIDGDGETQEYFTANDLQALVAIVQMGALEIHPWGARVDRIDRPDRITFDLDPDETLPWPRTISAAYKLRERLAELGLQSFVKTSGGKGLHLVIPILRRHTWDDVKKFAKQVARKFASDSPSLFTANMSKKARQGKIYIDYHRNSRGATSVAAYSTRARPAASVSTPLSWDELDVLDGPQAYHVGNVPQRLEGLEADPWSELSKIRQSITNSSWNRLQR